MNRPLQPSARRSLVRPAATATERAKLPLLWLYYQATWPYRRLRNGWEAARGRAPVVVLSYQRIADDAANPWTCSNRMFARHLAWLRRRFDMVSLAEAQERIRGGRNHRPCVSITFDNGYAENFREALPLLIREQIPCTYFVATRSIFRREPFPHDLAQGNGFLPNSLTQLRELASAGVEIGAQTRTLADLAKLADADLLKDEVVTAGEELQAALRRPVRYFAFPYGGLDNLNATAFQLAYDAGYDGVCSAYGGWNLPGDDAFHLQRIHGHADFVRIRHGATLDPRHRQVARYQYEPTRPRSSRAGATIA